MQQKKLVPLSQAIKQIFLYTLLITGSISSALWYFHHIKQMHATNDAYLITSIVQQTEDSEPLKNGYLVELLELSVDQPKNLYSFNTQEATKKLLTSPLIRKGSVKRIRPGTVFVQYSTRKPIAFLAGYHNTAIDCDGVSFPFHPFFTPKNLPEIYLGSVGDLVWGRTVQHESLKLAIELLNHCQQEKQDHFQSIRRIDLSKALASSLGQRQIVVIFDEKFELKIENRSAYVTTQRILRLNVENYKQGLANFQLLRNNLIQQEKAFFEANRTTVAIAPIIIDLRLPNLAFYSPIKKV